MLLCHGDVRIAEQRSQLERALEDAITLERKRLEKDEDNAGWYQLLLRRSKTGVPVYMCNQSHGRQRTARSARQALLFRA
jgi:predicted Ser/Thr protein kinase